MRDGLSDELQLEFRQLQKRHSPHLSQFLNLFHAWRDHYIAKLEAARRDSQEDARYHRDLGARIATRCPFRCVCGATGDPFDQEIEKIQFKKIHRKHVFVAADGSYLR